MNVISELPAERARGTLFAAARFMWRAGRRPLLAVLTLIEPVIRAVFSIAMMLGIVAATVFEYSAVGPRFPFLGVFAMSLGFGLALVAYYGLMSLVSR